MALSFLTIMCTEKPNLPPNSHSHQAENNCRKATTFFIMISKEIFSMTGLYDTMNKVCNDDLMGDTDKFYKVSFL